MNGIFIFRNGKEEELVKKFQDELPEGILVSRDEEFAKSYGLTSFGEDHDLRKELGVNDVIVWPIAASTQNNLYQVKRVEESTGKIDVSMCDLLTGAESKVTFLLGENASIKVPVYKRHADSESFWYIDAPVMFLDTPEIKGPTQVNYMNREQGWMGIKQQERVVDLAKDLGKDFKDYLKENGFGTLAYKEIEPKDSYYCFVDGKITHLMKQDFEYNLKNWQKEKKKFKVEINGRTVVFESTEDAKKVLGNV